MVHRSEEDKLRCEDRIMSGLRMRPHDFVDPCELQQGNTLPSVQMAVNWLTLVREFCHRAEVLRSEASVILLLWIQLAGLFAHVSTALFTLATGGLASTHRT